MKSFKLFCGIAGVALASYFAYMALDASITEKLNMGTGSVFSFGLLTAVLMLCAGIVAIAGRAGKKGTMAAGWLFLAAFVVGVVFHKQTGWMLTAGFISLALAALFLCHGTWMDAPKKAV